MAYLAVQRFAGRCERRSDYMVNPLGVLLNERDKMLDEIGHDTEISITPSANGHVDKEAKRKLFRNHQHRR